MSWHARWGRPDPYAKPVKRGDRFGCWEVVKMVTPDPHSGYRALCRCARCGFEAIKGVPWIRYQKPATHRGCSP